MFKVNVVSTVCMRTYLHSAVNFLTDKSRFMPVLSGLNDELFNCVKVQREAARKCDSENLSLRLL